jgi:hypothetical protein
LRIELAPTTVAKDGCLGECRVAKGTSRQKPESAAFAEPGFGTIICLAIRATMIIHNRKRSKYIRFSRSLR